MTIYEKWSLVGLWLGSIGTICVAFCALFGAAWKQWISKPKLEFKIKNGFPYCELIKRGEATESDPKLDIFEICATLENQKKFCARHSRVLCSGISVLTANGRDYCSLLSFRPKQFQWSDVPSERQSGEMDIGQSVLHFVKIAEISRPLEGMGANSSVTVQPQAASVVVAIPDSSKSGQCYVRVPIEHTRIRIEVQVLCSGCDAQCYNILIDWKGKTIEECSDPAKLSVSLETRRQQ